MYPGMVLCTRALPVSASMYVSTHFRQRVEEEEEGDEEEDEDEEEEGEEEDGGRGRRRGERGRGGGGGGGEQPHSEQRLHAYTTVTPPTREPQCGLMMEDTNCTSYTHPKDMEGD